MQYTRTSPNPDIRFNCKWCKRPKPFTEYKSHSRWGTRDKVCRRCRNREQRNRHKIMATELAAPIPFEIIKKQYELTYKEVRAVNRAAKCTRHSRPTADDIISQCTSDVTRQIQLLGAVSYKRRAA